MEIKTISVKVGATINLGNYESLRLDYGAEATLDFNESADEAITSLRQELTAKMREDLVNSNGGRDLLKQ